MQYIFTKLERLTLRHQLVYLLLYLLMFEWFSGSDSVGLGALGAFSPMLPRSSPPLTERGRKGGREEEKEEGRAEREEEGRREG